MNVRERQGIAVSKWCSSCKTQKILEKKEKHKTTKGYQKSKLKTLKKKAWTLFSEWIRRENAVNNMVRCYTCDVSLSYKEANAGHFFHGKLDYDSRNIKVQCVGCNLYKSGNLAFYGVRLAKELGVEGMEKLRLDANTISYTIDDLEEIIAKYTVLNSLFL